jgi:PAS domain S-box-containing protein
MRTLMATYFINSFINAIVMSIYWSQNKRHFVGLNYWVIALAMQAIGMLLLGIRGVLPDFITIVVSNLIIVLAGLIMLEGFKCFTGHKAGNYHNYLLVAGYAVLQYYFAFIQPSTSIRIIIISFFTSILFLQSGRILLLAKNNPLKSFTRITGIICYIYVLVQFFRVVVELMTPTTDYFNASFYANIGQVFNQFLSIAMVFSFIIMCNNINLHNRIKSEEEIKSIERKLRNFIDYTYDWEYLVESNGRISYVSPSVERITGYKMDEFLDNPTLLSEIVHPDDIPINQNHIHGASENIQFRIVDKNNQIHWIEHTCQMVYDNNGLQLGIRVSNRDITERKTYELENIASKLKIEELYNNAPCGYHSANKNGVIINMNATELAWLGYSREEVIGKLKIIDIGSAKSVEVAKELFPKLIKTGSVNNTRVELLTKNGDLLPVITNSKAVYDEEGNFLYSLTTVFDRSEINRIEEELKKARENADIANKAKSDFLSKMSHELRTPLNAIIVLSGVLDRTLIGKIPIEEHGYLNIIERSGKNLLEMINDLLDISRIESGLVELDFKCVDLNKTITDTIDLMNPLAIGKNIELIYRKPDTERYLTSDEDKIKHILQNLISNAIKFTDEGHVEISISRIGESYLIKVSDTGIGMEESNLESIFDEFRQADSTTTRRYGGTGLGLAIVKKYVELLGGNVLVKSQVGKGSTFTVEIPIAPVGELSAKDSSDLNVDLDKDNSSKKKSEHLKLDDTQTTVYKPVVLVVEDNPDNMMTVHALLRDRYLVLEASSGEVAFDLAKNHTIDLILMDINLPGISGIEVYRLIRSNPL